MTWCDSVSLLETGVFESLCVSSLGNQPFVISEQLSQGFVFVQVCVGVLCVCVCVF